MSKHEPTDDEEDMVGLADATAAAIALALLQQGGPAFAGAVTTLILGNLLATLEEDKAEQAIGHHVAQARRIRALVRRRLDKMEEAAQGWDREHRHDRPH